jgi:hypothetical protein
MLVSPLSPRRVSALHEQRRPVVIYSSGSRKRAAGPILFGKKIGCGSSSPGAVRTSSKITTRGRVWYNWLRVPALACDRTRLHAAPAADGSAPRPNLIRLLVLNAGQPPVSPPQLLRRHPSPPATAPRSPLKLRLPVSSLQPSPPRRPPRPVRQCQRCISLSSASPDPMVPEMQLASCWIPARRMGRPSRRSTMCFQFFVTLPDRGALSRAYFFIESQISGAR